MDKPILSAFVITYNQEKYIAQALDSILSQEHDYSYEIVIGDDCSHDSTPAILKEYAAKYPGIIKLKINESNVGMVRNYFDTIERCSGKYVALCAGDDWWLPGKVKLQVDYMESHPEVGMVYGKTLVYYQSRYKRYRNKEVGGPKVGFEELSAGNCISSPSVMCRRELVLEYCRDIEPLKRGWLTEDYPQWLWFAWNSRIVFQDSVIAAWRKTDSSLSHGSYLNRMKFDLSCHELNEFFARKYGTELADHVKLDYCYRRLMCLATSGDREGLEKMKPEVGEFHDRYKSRRTRKMKRVLRAPWFFEMLHGKNE